MRPFVRSCLERARNRLHNAPTIRLDRHFTKEVHTTMARYLLFFTKTVHWRRLLALPRRAYKCLRLVSDCLNEVSIAGYSSVKSSFKDWHYSRYYHGRFCETASKDYHDNQHHCLCCIADTEQLLHRGRKPQGVVACFLFAVAGSDWFIRRHI